ncbi:unnamed protein product, partial [Urochloa humidicola]
VVTGQVVRVALLPEAPLHHPARIGAAATFPGGQPAEVLGLQRRETSADSAAPVPRTRPDAFLHLGKIGNWLCSCRHGTLRALAMGVDSVQTSAGTLQQLYHITICQLL